MLPILPKENQIATGVAIRRGTYPMRCIGYRV
jgi:hypothetical protein